MTSIEAKGGTGHDDEDHDARALDRLTKRATVEVERSGSTVGTSAIDGL